MKWITSCAFAMIHIGCGVAVIPPASPQQPTTVYLCDYGVHSSLLLPVDGRGRYVEFLYGDWNWAALDHTGWCDAISAMFFSRQAALGRRYVTLFPDQSKPMPQPPPKTEVGLVVNGEGCRTALQRLQCRWEKHRSTAAPSGAPDDYFSYVKDDESYSWLHDCNHQTAACLEQMGCEVKGWALLSDFTVEPRTK